MADLAFDDFNRAGPGLGANWTTLAGRADPQISASTVVGGNTVGGLAAHAMYTAITWPNNQYVYATGTTLSGSSARLIGLWLRALATEITGYFVLLTGPAGASCTLKVSRYNAGTETILFGPTTKTFTAGQVIKATVVGNAASSTIIVYYDDVDQTGSVVDTTAIASGSPGVFANVTSGLITDAQLDDWGGGAITTPITGLRPAMRVPNVLVF